ncbi:MAG TPA: LytTR family DNA-binding domain-containing protein [Hyphomonas sp.]|nr:LytTR family DNA-binding domain-containing protein [Hyphomonas sp.]
MQGVFGLRIAIDWRTRARELGVYAAIGLFLAFIEPYDATRGLPFWVAFLYWTGLILIGSLSGETVRKSANHLWPDLPIPVRLAIISVASAAAVTMAIFVVERVLNSRQIPLEFLPTLFGLVWVISAAMTGIGFMMDRTILAPPPTAPEGAGPVETFLSRLPLKYRQAELYAVSSEDHYLRVHTSAGEELILMRLADAMRELDGAGGLQVHRSWWVAKSGVKDVRREGSKLSLVLASGKTAPVSRTYMAAVKEAGLSA